ncbi:MAG: hypothetical protein KDK30_12175 [Leptospiraceae bacterium]|nr:hypothetical protein [Leptospiraceae bacterium]
MNLSLSSAALSAAPPAEAPANEPAMPDQPVAIIDTQALQNNEIIRVPTVWDFYWNQLLTSDDFRSDDAPAPDARIIGMQPWTRIQDLPADGYATYRMLLKLPPGGKYGFRVTHQFTAYRVFVDGQLKATNGQVGEDRSTSRPWRDNSVFYFRPASEYTEIILHISNFHMYRGGLRGSIQVGQSRALEQYINLRRALELILVGFLLAVSISHLSFYLTQSREKAFLFFAILCLSFVIRIPFWGEKTIVLLTDAIPWAAQIRLTASLNILSPPLLMIFLRSVFPDRVSRRTVLIYAILSGLFMCTHLFDTKYITPSMFLMFLIILGPVLLHATIIIFGMAMKGDQSARIMSIGMFLFCVIEFYAMFLNYRAGENAAPYAFTGFTIFALFQSIALGRTYQESLKARENLLQRLARSREALARQRKELEINLHDNLGGALTDLKILTEQSLRHVHVPGHNVESDLNGLLNRVAQTNLMLRGQLLFIEDMELASRDPITGLQMMLLRRYSGANREFQFELDSRSMEVLPIAMQDDGWRLDFLMLTQEICTNDLKHGQGDSYWTLKMEANGTPGKKNILVIHQRNPLPNGSQDVESELNGGGRRTRERAARLGGSIRGDSSNGQYELEVRLPV